MKTILFNIWAICTLCCLTACNEPGNTLKFAIASDFHAADVPDGKERLAAFIETANQEKVDFIIELGDFCRLDSASQVFRNEWNGFAGDKGATVKGVKAEFMPPTPKDLNLNDSIGVFPLTSSIEDAEIEF